MVSLFKNRRFGEAADLAPLLQVPTKPKLVSFISLIHPYCDLIRVSCFFFLLSCFANVPVHRFCEHHGFSFAGRPIQLLRFQLSTSFLIGLQDSQECRYNSPPQLGSLINAGV